MRRIIISYIILIVGTLLTGSCKNNTDNSFTGTELQLLNVSPQDNETVYPGNMVVTFSFNTDVWILNKTKITVNGETTNNLKATNKDVVISLNTVSNTDYEIMLAAGAIRTHDGFVSKEDYSVSFKCVEHEALALSKEATNLYNFLKENYGKKVLSGTMANVSLNQNEAQWVYSKTGKYPAINCIDYIHLYASSAGSWIDYSQIDFLENWWNNNGIVAAMWHWNMLANNGVDYSCTPGQGAKETSFDVSKINDESSEEYAIMMRDIDKVADYLLLLKNKNIPVIWRPLHEAGGSWFWWGTDRQACIKLWQVMYNRFKEKGLNNLIWVWTLAIKYNEEISDGFSWYPGDDFVDIIGYDMYNVSDVAKTNDIFQQLTNEWPNKLITLSECGNVPDIGNQWNVGAKWSWFVTWYDYNRTNDTSSAEFNKDEHEHANADWWRIVMQNENVITRDKMPSLK